MNEDRSDLFGNSEPTISEQSTKDKVDAFFARMQSEQMINAAPETEAQTPIVTEAPETAVQEPIFSDTPEPVEQEPVINFASAEALPERSFEAAAEPKQDELAAEPKVDFVSAAANNCTYAYGRAQQPVFEEKPPVYEPQPPVYNRSVQSAQYSSPYSQPAYAANESAYTGMNRPQRPQRTQTAKPKKEAKEKKPKSRMSFGQVLLCLVLCLVVGSTSGYVSSKTAVRNFVEDYMETYSVQVPNSTGAYNINIYEQPTEATVQNQNEPATSIPTSTASDIYKRNVNAVVTINAIVRQTVNYGFFFGSQTQEVPVSGSGFFLTADGYILTNYHVVEGGENITVTDYDGNEYPATLVGYEQSNDIAVLKVTGTSFHAVQIGNSTDLEVGDTLLIIGNALGELQYTLTQGVVSYLERAVTTETGEVINMFQTDAAINSGNSGGPVFNAKGEVVGIASAKYASSSIEGLGFCIPIDDVKNMINDIINVGYVTGKPSVGVSLYTNDSRSSGRPYGCYVVAVGQGTAAAYAGISEGDIITAVNGTSVRDVDDFGAILADCKAGDTIVLTVYVASTAATREFTITLDEYTPTSARTSYSNVYDF